MEGDILLVLDSFDPITNYKLRLVTEAQKIINFRSIIFIYEEFGTGGDKVFQTEEKIFLLSSSIPNTPSPSYLIDGDSFSNPKLSVFQKINIQKQRYRRDNIYLLLDSKEYQILEKDPDWASIISTVQIILYILPEHKELINSYSITSKALLFINPSNEINQLSKASILDVNKHNFSETLIEYMNKSGECAIKRIKNHLSESRFKHSLRVAGTVKKICEMVNVEDAEFCYDAYLAALYHDICKEMPVDMQESIAQKILDMHDYSHWKVLHGPIAAWYLRNKYLFNNDDILEAIAQHTTPSEDPKRITVFVHLADKLEIGKKDRYPEDIYNTAWGLIENQKPLEAFDFLLNYFDSIKEKKEQK